MRNLLVRSAEIAELATARQIRHLIETVLGRAAFPVRALFFDKTPTANWGVPWHQDLAIPIQKRVEVAGFGPWSVKAGVPHAMGPSDILANMLSLRLHLDDATESNGALMVLPGTHHLGRMADRAVKSLANRSESRLCPARAGDAMLFRPLLVHASRKGTLPKRRRIIHIEFAARPLPAPLRWHAA